MNLRLVLSLLAILTLSACVSQTDRRADLKAVLQAQIVSCYVLPAEARGSEPVVVETRVNPDGSLERAPRVIAGQSNSASAKAALLALKKCTPFHIPEHWKPRHSDWRVMKIQFDTN